jgi:[acyl-carrier-protein] S-malonyltransferase
MPPIAGRFPMRLANHGAFHTCLQEPVSARAESILPMSLFAQPETPLIDGRGEIWFPKSATLPHSGSTPSDIRSSNTMTSQRH